MFFFFFKQKTAYGMRIRDWSSDVCSSDLYPRQLDKPIAIVTIGFDHHREGGARLVGRLLTFGVGGEDILPPRRDENAGVVAACARRAVDRARHGEPRDRSEEHTSELQSLMRISYAVFCLKQKNKIMRHHIRRNMARTRTRIPLKHNP